MNTDDLRVDLRGHSRPLPTFELSGVGTPESLEQHAADLANRAKAMRKADKKQNADRKARANRRNVALDALVRVAADPSKGYASVEAARTLLENS